MACGIYLEWAVLGGLRMAYAWDLKEYACGEASWNGQIILRKMKAVAIEPCCQLNYSAFLYNQYNLCNSEKQTSKHGSEIGILASKCFIVSWVGSDSMKAHV